jgi:hypothetical protein
MPSDAGNSTITASGYRRVPGRPFAKGQSGNINGRPKAVLELRDYAREFGRDGIRKLAAMAGLLPGEPPAEAEAVRVAAIKELLDRGYGRSTLVLSGDEDAPHVIRYEFSWGKAHDSVDVSPVIEAAAQDAAADGNGNGTDEVEIVWGTNIGDGSTG